ncbi:hypothetical protein TTSV1_gp24 [Thermoproteus tenax spherical virus 1]|uniref:Uncharacterized protein n=1 Tax=Thermoproteus tenax spherical virus 1 TaxID=292639 RepID=Q647D8_9VIRU|nr:hypothetical protein TTSV1_gp24 [Thermoproteus tenax spherical virus 1]AAU25974.1 hypothetical protein [Thermoproteus tenax spherical virus 1]
MEWKRFPIPLILAAVLVGAVLIIITINVTVPKAFYASSGNATITLYAGSPYMYYDTWPGTVTVNVVSGTAAFTTTIYYGIMLPSYNAYTPLIAILTNAPKAFYTTSTWSISTPVGSRAIKLWLEQDSSGGWWLVVEDTNQAVYPVCAVYKMNMTSLSLSGATYYLFYPIPTTATSTTAPIPSECGGDYTLVQSWSFSGGNIVGTNVYSGTTRVASRGLTATTASSVSYTTQYLQYPGINRTDLTVFYIETGYAVAFNQVNNPITVTITHS